MRAFLDSLLRTLSGATLAALAMIAGGKLAPEVAAQDATNDAYVDQDSSEVRSTAEPELRDDGEPNVRVLLVWNGIYFMPVVIIDP